MRVPSHPTQIRRMLDTRLKRLAPVGPALAATLTSSNKRYSQAACGHHGGPLHQAHHLTFKEEEVDLSEYEDFGDALRGLGRSLDDVDNRKRIHSSLGYLTPAEFEGLWREKHSANARAHVA